MVYEGVCMCVCHGMQGMHVYMRYEVHGCVYVCGVVYVWYVRCVYACICVCEMYVVCGCGCEVCGLLYMRSVYVCVCLVYVYVVCVMCVCEM